MGQNALIVCNASDYTRSEILKVFKQVSGNKKRRVFWCEGGVMAKQPCGFLEVGSQGLEVPVY